MYSFIECIRFASMLRKMALSYHFFLGIMFMGFISKFKNVIPVIVAREMEYNNSQTTKVNEGLGISICSINLSYL